MRTFFSILVGKTVRAVARIRGGGSALPGLVVERIDARFFARTLSQLPHGVVVVSGTNGKTTTTKMVVALLESQGLRVLTNDTGSNFVRGVIASILARISWRGTLDADIAVLELDEAHATHFVTHCPPRYCLLLNVLRDQLDRFGEIDTTAQFLHTIARATTTAVVVNNDDPLIGDTSFTDKTTAPFFTYGAAPELVRHFPSDDALRGNTPTYTPVIGQQHTSLTDIHDASLSVAYGDDTSYTIPMQLTGSFNYHNAAGALALCRAIFYKQPLDTTALHDALSHVQPAFGRGETLIINGDPVDILLVKNPSGFRLSLASYTAEPAATMIAINDQYADGRDVSWLWDVDFDSLKKTGVHTVSGSRSHDMTLRLIHDDIAVTSTATDIAAALADFIDTTSGKRRIYCTYTAMLAIRKLLTNHPDKESHT